jgi:hypothetical protein
MRLSVGHDATPTVRCDKSRRWGALLQCAPVDSRQWEWGSAPKPPFLCSICRSTHRIVISAAAIVAYAIIAAPQIIAIDYFRHRQARPFVRQAINTANAIWVRLIYQIFWRMWVRRLFASPTLCESHHGRFACLSIAMRRRAVFVIPKGHRPDPRRPYRGRMYFHDAADDSTIRKHVIVVIVPIARWAADRRAL